MEHSAPSIIPSSEKPKVLFILPSSVIGGAETKTFNLLHALKSFECILVTHADIADYYAVPSIRTYAFESFHSCKPYDFSPGNILSYAKAIKKIAERERPHCMLGIMHTGTVFSTVARDAFFVRIPSLVTIEGNISAYFATEGRNPTLKEKILLGYCLKRSCGIIVPSEGVKLDLISAFRVKPGKIRTIHNGIDIDSVRESSKQGVSYGKDCPWIVTACRLNNQKDFVTLLKAFRRVRDATEAKLLVVGGGELEEDIIRLSAELKVGDDVIMLGFQKNPFPYIAQADVFVLSSFYEGFGNVIVEAMALGVPVISTDCPSGPGEIIRDRENGFLVPVGDYSRMAEACIALLTDHTLNEKVSNEGQRRVQDFTVSTMAKGFEDYIAEILG